MIEKILSLLHGNDYLLVILIIFGTLLLFVNAGIYFRYTVDQQRKGENFWHPRLYKILVLEFILVFPLGIALALSAVADGTEITQEELGFMKPIAVCFPIFWIVIILAAVARGQSRLNRRRQREQSLATIDTLYGKFGDTNLLDAHEREHDDEAKNK